MDTRLVAWARSVKARQRNRAGAALPPLWLFTDAARLPDPAGAVERLPAGLCGVVLRHDADPDRVALGRALAAICRRRRLVLVVAGDWRLAALLHAGLHLRAGRRDPWGRRLGVLTSSAHGAAQIVRARRAGAALAFLSPAFPTVSHPGAAALGPLRWGRVAFAHGGTGMWVGALGGVDGSVVRRIPAGRCAAVGAISALA